MTNLSHFTIKFGTFQPDIFWQNLHEMLQKSSFSWIAILSNYILLYHKVLLVT